MAIIRMQNNVPRVYTQGSRDFQILCRIFDMGLNSSKLDADLVQHLTDTRACKNNTLELLQTKLGFFTKYELEDEMLRAFLNAFPEAIKNKGSLKAIRYAVNAFVKSKNIKDEIIVTSSSDDAFNIVIKTQHRLQDSQKLDEFLSYILPVGMTYEFQYYNKIPDMTTEVTEGNKAGFILVDNKTNASVRYSNTEFDMSVAELTNPSSRYTLLLSCPDDWGAVGGKTYYKYDGSAYVAALPTETWATNTFYDYVPEELFDMTISNVGLAGLSGANDTTTPVLIGNIIKDDDWNE